MKHTNDLSVDMLKILTALLRETQLSVGGIRHGVVKVLVLVADDPNPPVSGAKVRNAHLWNAMRRLGVDVRILGLDQLRRKRAQDSSARYFETDRNPLLKKVLGHFFYSYHQFPGSQALTKAIQNEVLEWQPDIVHAEELRMASYVPENLSAVRSLTLHNVESELLLQTGSSPVRFGKPVIDWIHRQSLRRYERRVLETFGAVFAFSPRDQQLYQGLYGILLKLTRNGTNALEIAPQPQSSKKNILLLGSLSYQPNIEGISWFLDKVLPLLPEQYSYTVAGSGVGTGLKSKILKAPRTQWVDTPPELGPLYARADVVAVPLFSGSGTRGRILEALAHERMVITTAKGAEGLNFTEETGVVLAADAERFSKEIQLAVEDSVGRERRAAAGRQKVVAEYDWSCIAEDLFRQWKALIETRI